LDALVESREAERFLQRAILEQGQGRGAVLGMVAEIQERHGAAAEMGCNLELKQVFNDIAAGGRAGGATGRHRGQRRSRQVLHRPRTRAAAGRLFGTSRGLMAPADPPRTEVAVAKAGSSRIKLVAAQLTLALEGAKLAAVRRLLP
jgi:hypothetical protein